MVRHWNFEGNGSSGNIEYPYINNVYLKINQNDFLFNFISEADYFWRGTPEVRYSEGTPGQNNVKPASLFGNHQFIWEEGTRTWYDPSYGLKDQNEQQMDNARSGFFRKGEGASLFFQKNPIGDQVQVYDFSFPAEDFTSRSRLEVR